MLGEKEKLTLEQYVAFAETRNRRRLSVDQLNQKAIIAALKPLELMPASRSTLDKNKIISSVDADAGLELEEIHWDITAIGWQECPLGSVMTIQSGGPMKKKRPMAIADWGTKKRRNGALPSPLPDPGLNALVVLADLVDSTTT